MPVLSLQRLCTAKPQVYILLPLGVSVFTLDFAGSGLSEGQYVTLGANEVEDIEVCMGGEAGPAGCSVGTHIWLAAPHTYVPTLASPILEGRWFCCRPSPSFRLLMHLHSLMRWPQ